MKLTDCWLFWYLNSALTIPVINSSDKIKGLTKNDSPESRDCKIFQLIPIFYLYIIFLSLTNLFGFSPLTRMELCRARLSVRLGMIDRIGGQAEGQKGREPRRV